MAPRSGISLASAAVALFALGAPIHAQAGGATTAHPISITLKGVSQGSTGSGDSVPDRFTVSTKDLFEACVGALPTKTQGLFLFLNCTVPNDNLIAAIDTEPLTLLEEVGSIDFDLANQVEKTKDAGGTLKSVTLPVEITINCAGGSTTATLNGIMDVNFSDLAGEDCPNTANVKLTGVASNPTPGNFVVDDGSSLKAKKRSASIATFPP